MSWCGARTGASGRLQEEHVMYADVGEQFIKRPCVPPLHEGGLPSLPFCLDHSVLSQIFE